MSDNDLYQEMILDHYKNPRNCCTLEHCSHRADGQNPICGDELSVEVEIDNDRIKNIAFTGMGCAISQASASMMTEQLKGKTIKEAMDIYGKVHEMLTGKHPEDVDPHDDVSIGKLRVLEGVAEFPARVKCASLAWHTLKNALNSSDGVSGTE